MALISVPYVFSVGQTIIASQHNSNFSTLYNDYNGNVNDDNIAAGAGIDYTKLALNGTIKNTDLVGQITDDKLNQIVSSGKVSGAAITDLSSLPAGAGPIPVANISSLFGAWVDKSSDYGSQQALTDGEVQVIGAGTVAVTDPEIEIFSDSNPKPTIVRYKSVLRQVASGWVSGSSKVRKGEYWRVTSNGLQSISVYWIPSGS